MNKTLAPSADHTPVQRRLNALLTYPIGGAATVIGATLLLGLFN